MSKNTVDDQILKGMGLEHIKDRIPSTVRIEWASSVHYIKQALYQDLMALVGEDEPFKNLYQWEQAEPINLEKQRIRQNINQYFGKENQ